MKSRALFVVCVAICALAPIVAPTAARAQSADALKKAQASFDQAQLDYLQGKYDEAAVGFPRSVRGAAIPAVPLQRRRQLPHEGQEGLRCGVVRCKGRRLLQKVPDRGSERRRPSPRSRRRSACSRAKSSASKTPTRAATAVSNVGSGSAGSGSNAGSGSAADPVVAAPSVQEVQQLGDVKVRGLVVIESRSRQNATIYLDDKKKGPFAHHTVVRLDRRRAQDHHREARLQGLLGRR